MRVGLIFVAEEQMVVCSKLWELPRELATANYKVSAEWPMP